MYGFFWYLFIYFIKLNTGPKIKTFIQFVVLCTVIDPPDRVLFGGWVGELFLFLQFNFLVNE
jgi:hypothetical protein